MPKLRSPGGFSALFLTLAIAPGCEGPNATSPGPAVAHTTETSAIAAAPSSSFDPGFAWRGPPAPAPPADSVVAPTAPRRPAHGPDVRLPTDWHADYAWKGNERLAHAQRSKGDEMKKLFADAGVSYPPHDLLFRVFKEERELEVWVGDANAPMKRIATYGVCAASGHLGPKRAENDLQVPEGYYKVGYYYPMSSYYLSAQVDYPNASDKVRGGPALGGDILIHGSCASIGCISMTDERMEEIYLVGWAAFMNGRPTNIHIFPSRDIDALLADPTQSANHDFWREIAPGLAAFDETHRLPTVRIERDGRYVIVPAT